MKIKTDEYTVAAVVARFQVHELTEAHKELLKTVINSHPKVLIFLGLSPVKGSINNPLDYQPRKQMILEAFPSNEYPNITIGYIKDIPDDAVWSKNLDALITDNLGPKDKVVLYGGRDSFLKVYAGKFPTLELVSQRYVSGTQIRKQVAEKPQSHPLFRAGAIWSTHQRYPTVYSTVDVAAYNPTTQMVLLGRKPDEALLRFPGGFVDPQKDDSVEAAVARELEEETGLFADLTTLEYLGSYKVDDWRYRSEVDKIMTHFYLSYVTGSAAASDDIAEVVWADINKTTEDNIVPQHRMLWRALKKRLSLAIPQGKATFLAITTENNNE